MGKRELKYGKIRGWLCRLDYTFRIFIFLVLYFLNSLKTKRLAQIVKKTTFVIITT